jgi:hypothetical protein
MAIQYKQFIDHISDNPLHLVEFYFPDGRQIPIHFHLTDVGSVFRHFIDCGGQTRDESYVQIQLWLGKDTHHRLNGETMSKIIKQSSVVLDKLPNLQSSSIVVEYKEELTSQYQISEMEIRSNVIKFYLKMIETQCLAAIRYEQEKNSTSCCNKHSGCC